LRTIVEIEMGAEAKFLHFQGDLAFTQNVMCRTRRNSGAPERPGKVQKAVSNTTPNIAQKRAACLQARDSTRYKKDSRNRRKKQNTDCS
jgi:hypothetical protein